MKIKMKSLMATAEGIFYPDNIYDVDEELARNLVKKGYAKFLIVIEETKGIETEKIEYEKNQIKVKNKKVK